MLLEDEELKQLVIKKAKEKGYGRSREHEKVRCRDKIRNIYKL